MHYGIMAGLAGGYLPDYYGGPFDTLAEAEEAARDFLGISYDSCGEVVDPSYREAIEAIDGLGAYYYRQSEVLDGVLWDVLEIVTLTDDEAEEWEANDEGYISPACAFALGFGSMLVLFGLLSVIGG